MNNIDKLLQERRKHIFLIILFLIFDVAVFIDCGIKLESILTSILSFMIVGSNISLLIDDNINIKKLKQKELEEKEKIINLETSKTNIKIIKYNIEYNESLEKQKVKTIGQKKRGIR
jgi:hypothetical protein